jgi:hypothetical protein
VIAQPNALALASMRSAGEYGLQLIPRRFVRGHDPNRTALTPRITSDVGAGCVHRSTPLGRYP